MLDIQKKLSKPFLALLALPATAVGFALSTQIAALSWILSNKYGLKIDEVAYIRFASVYRAFDTLESFADALKDIKK